MRPALRPTFVQAAGLAALAGVAALVSNAVGPAARRLAWRGSVAARPAAAPLPAPPVTPGTVAPPPPEAAAPPPPVRPAAPARVRSAVAAPAAAAAPAAPIRDIGGAEAWSLHQQGAPFLDARRSAEFTEGHIAGAWCTPVWESDLEDRLLAFKAARRPGPEDAIVIYCSGGDCRDSHLLAARLLDAGYFHLLIYRGGFPDWVAQGRPVEPGRP